MRGLGAYADCLCAQIQLHLGNPREAHAAVVRALALQRKHKARRPPGAALRMTLPLLKAHVAAELETGSV